MDPKIGIHVLLSLVIYLSVFQGGIFAIFKGPYNIYLNGKFLKS